MNPSASYYPGWRDNLCSPLVSNFNDVHVREDDIALGDREIFHPASSGSTNLSTLLSPMVSTSSIESVIPGTTIPNQWQAPGMGRATTGFLYPHQQNTDAIGSENDQWDTGSSRKDRVELVHRTSGSSWTSTNSSLNSTAVAAVPQWQPNTGMAQVPLQQRLHSLESSREISSSSQHSRASASSINSSIWGSNNMNTTTTNGAGGGSGSLVIAGGNDDFSRSSHTSTSTMLLSSHPEEGFDGQDIHSGNQYPLHESKFLASLNLGRPQQQSSSSRYTNHIQSSFQSHQQRYLDERLENSHNQPPKQPVRRPSYTSNTYLMNNSTNNISSSSNIAAASTNSTAPDFSSFLPSCNAIIPAGGLSASSYSNHFSTNAPREVGLPTISPVMYASGNSQHELSSLQQAVSAFSQSTSLVESSTASIPGLMAATSCGASTCATASLASSSSSAGNCFAGNHPRRDSQRIGSSLAAAAAAGRAAVVPTPPPGFQNRTNNNPAVGDTTNRRQTKAKAATNDRNQRSSHQLKAPSLSAYPGRSSPITLKDRSSNVELDNRQQYGFGLDMKDDLNSVTSATTNTTATSVRSSSIYQYQPAPSSGEAAASSSQAIRALLDQQAASTQPSHPSLLSASSLSFTSSRSNHPSPPILPQVMDEDDYLLDVLERDLQEQRQCHYKTTSDNDTDEEGDLSFRLEGDDDAWSVGSGTEDRHSTDGHGVARGSLVAKKREWLLRMNRKLADIAVGELDPATVPVSAVMNAWAKTKSAQGAAMVELWLKRAQEEYEAGNRQVVPTTKMYTMAVDAWARSGEGGTAAQRAEALLQQMYELYQSGGHEELRPTNAIFNAVINSWARSHEKIAPVRAEQILNWMQNLSELDIFPDKYTFNTVVHAWAKAGGAEAAAKAQELLARMHRMYQDGYVMAKPDTISYNVVINAWAKSGGKGASSEAEKLLSRMHRLHEMGDPDVKPNVVTYGAVIDSFAKSGERGAAARADALLANMIQLHQADPVKHADLLPNTYVFNTVINCWAKSKEHDAASKAEEMLVAMSRLHSTGMPSLKPDNFTYTAVIDAWAKSGYRGAAARADQLLDKMEVKYLAGDIELKPNSYTYNAVICALAKSGEAGAAARAERVLQNMVNRHRTGGDDDIKPTTINFNTVLDAWAKSRGGRAAAERAEEILEWMDHLHKSGNVDVRVDTISFNAVLDAWARSGDRVAPRRAEQILNHMDDLFRAGNKGVKPDRYTYNTLINVWAKCSERGSAARAENVLSIMEKRFRDGDQDFKPNTRTYTSVIDAWAKSGEKGAARRAEQILNNMISRYEAAGDPDVKPNVHTANAVCNACAFSKNEEDRDEALQIAFRVVDWLANQSELDPDSYTFTILLSVCANLLPRDDSATRFNHAQAFFIACREAGHVNDYVLRKLRQTVSEGEFFGLIEYRTDATAGGMPASWTRNAKIDNHQHHQSKNTRKSGASVGSAGGSWNSRNSGRRGRHNT